jgi:hypothetical protein
VLGRGRALGAPGAILAVAMLGFVAYLLMAPGPVQRPTHATHASQSALSEQIRKELVEAPELELRLRYRPEQQTAAAMGTALHLRAPYPDLRVLVVGRDVPTLAVSGKDGSVALNHYQGLAPELTVQGAAIVALAQDTVVISGGHALGDPADPASGQHVVWRIGPYEVDRSITMLQPRAYHAAFQADAGELVVLGGESATIATDSVERVDLADGISHAAAPLLVARSRFAAVALPGSRLLLTGGIGRQGMKAPALASAEIYDLQTRASSPAPPMRVARHSPTALRLQDDRVVVVGGLAYDAKAQRDEPIDAVEIWAEGQWRDGPSLNFPRAHPVLIEVDDGGILVLGGGNAYIERWDRASDRWDIVGFGTPSFNVGIPVDERRIALAQGADPPGHSARYWGRRDFGAFQVVGRLKPHVAVSGHLSLGRQQAASVELSDGRLLVTGGHVSSSLHEGLVSRAAVLNQMEIYDVRQERSVATGQLRYRRFDHQAFRLPDGKVAVVGGFAAQDRADLEPVLAMEVIDPQALRSEAVPTGLVSRRCVSGQLPDGDLVLIEDGQAGAARAYRWNWRNRALVPLNEIPGLARAMHVVPVEANQVLVLGSKTEAWQVDVALLWNIETQSATLLPPLPHAISYSQVVPAARLGYVGLIGEGGAAVLDLLASAWIDRTEFIQTLSEDPGGFAPALLIHIGAGRLLSSNVRRVDPRLGFPGGTPGIVDLFAGKTIAGREFSSHPLTVAPLHHSNGKLYFVGNRTGIVREDPLTDPYAAVPSISPPGVGLSPFRLLRELRTRWAMRG